MIQGEFAKQLKLLGVEVRRLRTERGHSQERFADLCGLDRTYIGGIERGERNVSFVNLFRISQALDISLSELFECLINNGAQ